MRPPPSRSGNIIEPQGFTRVSDRFTLLTFPRCTMDQEPKMAAKEAEQAAGDQKWRLIRFSWYKPKAPHDLVSNGSRGRLTQWKRDRHIFHGESSVIGKADLLNIVSLVFVMHSHPAKNTLKIASVFQNEH